MFDSPCPFPLLDRERKVQQAAGTFRQAGLVVLYARFISLLLNCSQQG